MTLDVEPSIGNDPRPGRDRDPALPFLVVLFVGSGCAALIYEVVWFQMLQLVIGATGISLGVLLGAFMAGMCAGSLLLPRHVSAGYHPLRVYAVLEVGLAVTALVLLAVIPVVGSAYVAVAPAGTASVVLRALLAGLVLLPPTILMGATLPAISRYVEATPRGVSWMGFFYGGNLAGAVLGCLFAGFWLLRRYDVVVATSVGVALNLAVAGVAAVLARRSRVGDLSAPRGGDLRASLPATEPAAASGGGARVTVLIAIGLSGFAALGSEVVWTRLMALLLGATTYTFSIILAVFLAALGVGSALGSLASRHARDVRSLFAVCQAGAALGIAWSAWAISAQLPYWPINPSIALEPGYVFQLDLVRAIWALAPAPVFWGASFPLAVAAAAHPADDPGWLVGRVYAANTVGAIAGALAYGVLVVPWVGSRFAQSTLVLAALAASALLILTPRRRGAAALILVAIGALAVSSIPDVPPVLVAYGRYSATYDPPDALYVGEGRNSSVAVTRLSDETLNLHVGGKIVASTEPQDMRLQGMLGHLTALLHPDPRSVLIVGFGAGVTAGTFVTHPGIERIVIAEIEPLVVEESAAYFLRANNDVLSDPRVEIVHDDARHYLLTSDETFDLVTSDPIHPWMKGAAALYSEEYFRLVRDHLNEGGVITQWVPLYESSPEAVRSEMATFFEVFPDGTVWGNTEDGSGYDVVMAAGRDGLTIDVDAFVERILSPGHGHVASDLDQVGFGRAMDLLGTYAGNAADLRPWLEGAEINRDRSLRLMYLAGLGLNRYDASSIYREILDHRSFPDELFRGDPQRLAVLRDLIGLR